MKSLKLRLIEKWRIEHFLNEMRGKGRGKNKIVDWQLVAAPADDIVEIDIYPQ